MEGTYESVRKKVYRIVILGGNGVGKSALKLEAEAIERKKRAYDTHIKIQVDGEECFIDITTEQEEFVTMRELYMKQGEGFIFVYSITDFNSFLGLSQHLKTLLRVSHSEPTPIILVGNKADLEDERKVSYIAGVSLAKVLECEFLESSTVTKQNITEMFAAIVRGIKKREMNHGIHQACEKRIVSTAKRALKPAVKS